MCFLDITLIFTSPHCPSSFISLETLTASRKGVLEEKVFLEISQNSQENTSSSRRPFLLAVSFSKEMKELGQ